MNKIMKYYNRNIAIGKLESAIKTINKYNITYSQVQYIEQKEKEEKERKKKNGKRNKI